MENEKLDELIYRLIFSKENEFVIFINNYIEDLYTYDKFVDKIKSILRRSKVMVVRESIQVDMNEVRWNLKIKK
jgi:hypothetical protein